MLVRFCDKCGDQGEVQNPADPCPCCGASAIGVNVEAGGEPVILDHGDSTMVGDAVRDSRYVFLAPFLHGEQRVLFPRPGFSLREENPRIGTRTLIISVLDAAETVVTRLNWKSGENYSYLDFLPA